MTEIPLLQIRIDGGTQSREKLNQEVIYDYTELIRSGVKLPPVILFYDGCEYWLADGFHRYSAASIAVTMEGSIEAEVKQGSRRDAVLYSVGANAVHGLRRTHADKRRAVETLLNDEEWKTWSDRAIAQKCGVSNSTVGEMRKRLGAVQVCESNTSPNPSELTRTGQDGKTYPALTLKTTPKPQVVQRATLIDEGTFEDDTQLEISFQLDKDELRIWSPWDSVALTYPQALNLLTYLDNNRHKLKARLPQAC